MDAPAKKRKTMPAMSTGPTPAAAWHMLQEDARAMAEVYGKGDNDGTEPLPLSSALRQVSSYVEALKKPDDNRWHSMRTCCKRRNRQCTLFNLTMITSLTLALRCSRSRARVPTRCTAFSH